MTPDQHNKYVGISHLVYAGFQLLMLIFTMVFIGITFAQVSRQSQSTLDDPLAWFWPIMAIAMLLNVVLAIPPIIAGYALLKRRPWAKIAGIVGGAVGVMNFPLGWALAAYTFWFLLSDVGRQIYDKDFRVTLPPPPPPPPSEWEAAGPIRS
jgi:hypothetical protein